jgi:hypothetical protein
MPSLHLAPLSLTAVPRPKRGLQRGVISRHNSSRESHAVSALPDEIDVLPLTALLDKTTSESVMAGRRFDAGDLETRVAPIGLPRHPGRDG